MSKKTNTLLFILGGTVFNILVTIVSFLILFYIFMRLIYPMLPEDSGSFGVPIVFLLAIAISFVVYRQVIKYVTKKIDMDKYFDPIFGPRRPPAKR